MIDVSDKECGQEALRRMMRDAGLELTPEREEYLEQPGLTATEAGDLIGISRQAITKQILSGRIAADLMRFAGNEVWQIEPRAVLEYALERKLEEERREETRRRRQEGQRDPTAEPEHLSPELKQLRRRILDGK